MPLTNEQIQQLLANQIESKSRNKKSGSPTPTTHPRPQQIGPLRLAEKDRPCISNNCGSFTRIRVEGSGPLCTTHALYALNKLVVDLTEGEDYLKKCTCKPGEFSKGHTHVLGCTLFILDKETVNAHL